MMNRLASTLIASLVLGCLLAMGSLSACSSTTDTPADGDLSDGETDGDIEADRDADDGDIDLDSEPPDGDLDLESDGETEPDAEEIENDSDAEADPEIPVPGCNGHLSLCDKRFDEVAYATTHNSMSNKDDDWVAPNQIHNISTQLADGVRGFMLDAYYYEDDTWLCHGDCVFGRKKLSEGLAEFTAFLASHPNVVLTIIFESYISSADTETAFTTAGLLDYVHTQTPGEPWPTLDAMIASGHRLVVFTDNPDDGPGWYHDVWEYCWDTSWHVTTLEDFVCDIGRGSQDNSLFILNHMLYGSFDLPSQSQAEIANANPFFLERATGCQQETGRLPNFVTVDFYSIGDLFEVVDHLNGVAPGERN
jgi:hypothetical protein